MRDKPSRCAICGDGTGLLFGRTCWPVRYVDLTQDHNARRRIEDRDVREMRDAPRRLRVTVEAPDENGASDVFCAQCARAAVLLVAKAMAAEKEEK